MSSTNSACTTSIASSRSRSSRWALRTSAGPYARYAAWGSLTASTLHADGVARAVLEPVVIAERAVRGGRARAPVVALLARRPGAVRARAVVVARARRARGALVRARVAQVRRVPVEAHEA